MVVPYERTAEIRVCHNNWDGGLTLASDNQLGAGHLFRFYLFVVISP